MRRPWQIWLAFGICLAAVLLATAWLSYKALQADGAEQLARSQAALEENARLALWRMDSFVAPLVAQESIRPVIAYGLSRHTELSRFANPNEPIPENYRAADARQIPAERDAPAHVRLYFEIESDGTIRSDRASLDERDTAFADTFPPMRALQAHGRELYTRVQQVDAGIEPAATASNDNREKGEAEYQARKRSVEQSNFLQQKVPIELSPIRSETATLGDDKAGRMIPMWVSDNLILARRARIGATVAASDFRSEKFVVQGCVFDWPWLKKRLLHEINDLLPHADLVPANESTAARQVRLMASLPVELVPGPLGVPSEAGLSPIQLSLLVTWSALAVATAAVAVLLHGVITLSERRAAFVSAVTHELRTPLTTFRMYAEMLSEGMVNNETDRRRYLETLHMEADRLTHLVANVLAYARLERGGIAGRLETIRVDALLKVACDRLADRAGQAGFVLSVEAADEVRPVLVRADASAVEQVLFNLVDNACKYAEDAAERTIKLATTATGNAIELRVCDRGPGLSAVERRRLFQPFRKSAREAANSAPGVGLGLTLSRRLAREMGGDLRYEPQSAGSCFVLALPRAQASREA